MGEDILMIFFRKISGNSKILTSHVSLFIAIIHFKEKDNDFFKVTRKKLMKISKINSTATYHKCISDLVSQRFIIYEPSFNPILGSRIKILYYHE
jgi:hypothetical protein